MSLPNVAQYFGEKKESNRGIIIAMVVFFLFVVLVGSAIAVYFAFFAGEASSPAPTGNNNTSSADKNNTSSAGNNNASNSTGATKTILPRQTSATLTDCGYATSTRGWYDMQNQGVKNDYCRTVGDAPNTFFSCALAGSPNQYTDAKVVYDAQLPHENGGTGPCST